jgi:hypothetical protein
MLSLSGSAKPLSNRLNVSVPPNGSKSRQSTSRKIPSPSNSRFPAIGSGSRHNGKKSGGMGISSGNSKGIAKNGTDAKRPSAKSSKHKSPSSTSSSSASPSKVVVNKSKMALELLGEAPREGQCGKTAIIYNHYRKQFDVYNGVCKFADIDEEYSFSFVYRGAFTRDLLRIDPPDAAGKFRVLEPDEPRVYLSKDEASNFFLNVEPNAYYRIEVVEDAVAGIGAEGLRINDSPLNLSTRQVDEPGRKAGNLAVREITQELLDMDTSELHSDKARKLKEARDIEDILFS